MNGYTDDEIKYLEQNLGNVDYENIVKELNEKFNSQRTVEGVRKKMIKIKNKGTYSGKIKCTKCKAERMMSKNGYEKKIKENPNFVVNYVCKFCKSKVKE